MLEKKPEYIINCWNGGSTNGTSTIYRTNDMQAWLDKIKELILENKVRERMSRVIVRDNLTIFSFARSENAYFSWRFGEMVKQPDYMKIGYPKEIVES